VNSCIFCKIIAGEIPAEIIYSDDFVVAFSDIAPKAPVHILLIPKRHLRGANELLTDDAELLSHIFSAANVLAKKFNIDKSGYRVITNNGKDAGQSVDHLHFHLLGGKDLGDLVG